MTVSKHFAAVLLLLFSNLELGFALARTTADNEDKKTPTSIDEVELFEVAAVNGVFKFDYGIPSSPALNLIGIAPEKITPSTSLKPFVLSIPTLLGSGSDGQSVALDMAPAWFFEDEEDTNYNDYAREGAFLRRLSYRSRIGLAIFEGEDADDPSDEKPSRLALSFSISILDDSDPLLTGKRSWKECLSDTTLTRSVITELGRRYDNATVAQELGYVSTLRTEVSQVLRRLEAPAIADERRFIQDKVDGWIRDIAKIAGLSNLVGAPVVGNNRQETKSSISGFQERIVKREQELVADEAKGITRRIAAAVQNKEPGTETLLASINKCTQTANRLANNAPDLDIGTGVLWTGEPGSFQDFDEAGFVAWAAYKHPLNVIFDDKGELARHLSVGGSIRYAINEFVATGNSGTPQVEANTINGWIGIEWQNEGLRFAAQYGYLDVNPSRSVDETFGKSGDRFLISAATRIGTDKTGFWISLSYGSADGTIDTLDDEKVLVSLNFGPPDPFNIFN